MEFRIRGRNRWWTFFEQLIDGVCVYTSAVFIDPRQRGQRQLDTWIHEALHAEAPHLTEAEVRQLAGFLARVLWSAGYRRHPRSLPAKKAMREILNCVAPIERRPAKPIGPTWISTPPDAR